MDNFEKSSKKFCFKDWGISLILGAVALALYAMYAFASVPIGLEDVVMAWMGSSSNSYVPFPAAGWTAGLFGMSKYCNPVLGGLSVVLLFHVVNFFLRECLGFKFPDSIRRTGGRIGGVVACLVFILTPSVFSAATHWGPAIFDTFIALLSIAVFIPFAKKSGFVSYLVPALSGIIVALGSFEIITLFFLLPLCGVIAWIDFSKKEMRGYLGAGVFLMMFFVAMIFLIAFAQGGFSETFGNFIAYQKSLFKGEFRSEYWYLSILFALLPFVISICACITVCRGDIGNGLVGWIFHFIISIVAVIAAVVVSSVLGYSGYQPSLVSAAVAAMTGYVLVYWWSLTKASHAFSSSAVKSGNADLLKKIGYSGGIGFALVMGVVMTVNFAVKADFSDNASLHSFSEKVIESLEKTVPSCEETLWVISNDPGDIEDSLGLIGLQLGKKINFVSFSQESNSKYLKRLAQTVLDEKLGGEELSKELHRLLTYDDGIKRQRLLPFVESWFKNDPDVADKVVVWGVPHLWMNAGVEAMPGLYFFTAKTGDDDAGLGDWLEEWPKVKDKLDMGEAWGSYRFYRNKRGDNNGLFLSGRDKKIGYLRRYVGFMATCQGNYHHEKGLRHLALNDKQSAEKCFDKAFELYDLVVTEIDPDNVAALANIDLLAEKNKFSKAVKKEKEIKEIFKTIAKDPNRRYNVRDLMLVYGSVCDPDFIMKYANVLSLGGQHAQGIAQIRRAIDLLPVEQRSFAELSMLVPRLEEGSDKEREEARKIYIEQIRRNPTNREANFRLSSLEVRDGNIEKAIEYLEKGLEGVENNPDYSKQRVQLCLMKKDLDGAEVLLMEDIDRNPKDIQAWTLLTHVKLQRADKLKEGPEKKKIMDDIDENLSTIKKFASGDKDREFMYESINAIVLMRKAGKDAALKARNSFDKIADSGHGSAHAGDMVLTLDMRLDDKEHAEKRAQKILAKNPDDSLANYIMGSLYLGREDYSRAEKHLRKSVSGKRIALLAYNDLAEVLRKLKKYDEAEKFARKAVEVTPDLYVAHETLGAILLDNGGSDEEAERCIKKACELSKDENGRPMDVRMLISLARLQLKRGEKLDAKDNLRIIQSRVAELTAAENKEFQELLKGNGVK